MESLDVYKRQGLIIPVHPIYKGINRDKMLRQSGVILFLILLNSPPKRCVGIGLLQYPTVTGPDPKSTDRVF